MKGKRKPKSSTHTDKCCDCADTGQQTTSGCPRDDTFSFTSCSLKKLLIQEAPKLMMALIVIGGALSILLLLRCMCCPAIITDFTQERRDRRSDDAIKDERKPWETSKSRLMNEFSELTGKDTKESNLHSGDAEYPEYMLPELSSILDPIKVNEGYGSNNLREFYRKLLKTDIQIKNFKKGFSNKRGNSLDFTDPNSSRLKRSPITLTDAAGSRDGSLSFNKRSLDRNQYYLSDAWTADNDGKVQDDIDVAWPGPKSPLEKSAETQKKEQKPEPEYIAKDKEDVVLNPHQPTDSKTKNVVEHLHFKHHDLLNALFGRHPSTQQRRLLQQDEDDDEEENVDYEEQTKEPWDREKRTVKPELNTEKQTEPDPTVNVAKTTNPDKQDPEPLYSGEINYLIEAAMRMVTGKLDATDYKENTNDLTNSNTEYFEDNGNYADLVEMAQAYSDYGVLNSKKEIVEKNKALGNTIKLLASEKKHEILEQIHKVDNSLHGYRVKLKSNGEASTERINFLKKFKQKMFSKAETTTVKVPSRSKIANATHFAITSTPWNMFNQKKVQKHNKERNVMYSGHRRSLKSVELEEIDDSADATNIDTEPHVNNTVRFEINENSTTVKVKDTNGTDLESQPEHHSKSDINETNNLLNVSVNLADVAMLSDGTLKRNNTSWGLGEIFGMFADISMFLSGFDENQEESGYRFLYDLITMLNPSYLQNKTAQGKMNDTRAPIEASIDSEMVDNIGHRSRVLMSFEEKAENSTVANDPDKEDRSESYVITTNKENTNTTRDNKIANTSKIEINNAVIEAGNRTVVKRSANGNVIFWNDLYDDEYGVKDPMEDDMKDKSSVKFNDLVGKDNWISNKFKMLAKTLRERRNRKMETKNRKFKNSRNKTKSHNKRAVSVPDASGKQMFEGLAANMKRVCHEAAQAIHETTNREVRADTNQASTLMQQLVSLMSELVDLQVRAKTCVQLPEDLRSFLAWLTSPSTEEREDIGFSVDTYDAGPNNLHNPETYDLSNNARSECLGTIHDVEELILQYDEMSEEDKSKMSGVREYLEHQLHYLHKQLSSFNDYGSAMYQDQPIRRRRQLNSKKHQKRRAVRFLTYGRKHTKSTDFDDSGTEDYKSIKFSITKGRNDYKHDNIKDGDAIDFDNDLDANEIESRKIEDVKRNLKDDYYSGLVKDNDTVFKVRT